MASTDGLLATSIRAITGMTRDISTAKCFGTMAPFTKVTGVTVSRTAMAK